MSVFAHLRRNFPTELSRDALVRPGKDAVSFEDLLTRSGAFAAVLAERGVPEAACVAVQVDKCADFLALYLAILRSGRVFLPLNPTYTGEEVAYYLGDSRASLLVCQPERQAEMETIAGQVGTPAVLTLGDDESGSLVEEAIRQNLGPPQASRRSIDVAPADEAPAVILYTSGTTGKPKGAVLSQSNVIAMIESLHGSWGWTSEDVLLHALPLFHIHGLFVAASVALRAGATTVLLPRFDPDVVLDWLPRTTMFMGVPTLYHRLLRSPRLSSDLCQHIRLFVCGSAPLSVSDFDEFQARTGHTILERYGMTETGMLISNPLDGPRKGGAVGLPLPGVEARLANQETFADVEPGEVGEIWVRGPNVFSGYLGRPEANVEAFVDGWFRTGDLGRADADGYYYIVGRAKDVVISGGLNVYPAEVETVLDAIDGVEESAVIGVADEDLGERVAAIIVRSRPELTPEQISAATRLRLAPYKCPRRIEFVDALPRNAMGKIDKEQLRRAFA